jgi:transcription initiation factor TFIIB
MCPNCGCSKLIVDPGKAERICSKCGLVVSDELLNRSPEWRAFNLKEREAKKRTGIPTNLSNFDKGLYTTFRTKKDFRGNRLKPRTRGKMWRLKRLDTRSKMGESRLRNLSDAMNELKRLEDKLHLTRRISEKAALIYRKALEKELMRGRTIAGFAAASTYAACRQAKIPRSLREVAEASTENIKTVSRSYRILIRELGLKMPVDHPMKYVPKIVAEIGITRETERFAIELLRKAKRRGILTGKDPRGIAASSIYLACKIKDEKCIQKDVAYAAGTTEVTLRNRLKDLKKMVEQTELQVYDSSDTIELQLSI